MVALLLLRLVTACASPPAEAGLDARLAGVEAEFQPALLALRGAVRDDADDTARGILDRLMARKPRGEALELALAFERILAGRAALGELSSTLLFEELERRDGSRELALELFQVWVNLGALDVELRPGPTSLRLERESIDARGQLGRRVNSEVLAGFDSWTLPAGGAQRRSLGVFLLPVPTDSMAARLTCTVSHLPGFVLVDGRELPAQRLPQSTLSRQRLADFMPTAPVSAAEWLTCARSPRAHIAALLERTVRLAEGEREEVLRALARDQADIGRAAWERAMPALRWLLPEGRQLSSPEHWRQALAVRAAALERERGGSGPVLDIPQVRR
ncbi:MAG: hypothetical protein QF724_10165 [Planctomycetota bacterium]|nr:hypothetical protein [Planctomycetota bacterium]MDP6956738.1 hypothetical protein [Planctomycetota bacterium]